MVDRVPPPRRSPHQQHARPPDARHEPLFRPWPTPARFPRSLPVALPIDLRIVWWIPMSTPPKSVTVSEFLGLGQVPTPARTPCRWVAGITRRRVGAHPALREQPARVAAVLAQFGLHDRPGPDQAHLPPQDVPELRELIQAGSAQAGAEPRDTVIIFQFIIILKL